MLVFKLRSLSPDYFSNHEAQYLRVPLLEVLNKCYHFYIKFYGFVQIEKLAATSHGKRSDKKFRTYINFLSDILSEKIKPNFQFCDDKLLTKKEKKEGESIYFKKQEAKPHCTFFCKWGGKNNDRTQTNSLPNESVDLELVGRIRVGVSEIYEFEELRKKMNKLKSLHFRTIKYPIERP